VTLLLRIHIIFICLLLPTIFRAQEKTDTTWYKSKAIQSITVTQGDLKHKKYFFENGKLKEESHHKNDTLNGEFRSWHFSGKIARECFYETGLLKGESKTWFEDGNPFEWNNYSITRENGKRRSVQNGIQKKYNKDGKAHSQIEYKDGKKDGTETEWYTSGSKKRENTYKGGYKKGPCAFWYESGNPGNKGEYDTLRSLNYQKQPVLNEVKTGYWETWFASGKKQTEGKFEKGKQMGRHTEWYENGSKKTEAEYKDGNVNGENKRWHGNGKLHIACNSYSLYDSLKRYNATYYQGKYEEYDESGAPIKSGEYDKTGRKIGKWQSYSKGVLGEEAEYADGRLINKHTLYWPNKTVVKTEFYKAFKVNGKDTTLLDGEVLEYHDNGKLRAQAVYKKGELQPPGIKTFGKSGMPDQELTEDETSIQKIEYNENGTKKREWRAMKDPAIATKDLKYFTEKIYDNTGQLRMRIDHHKGKALGYVADWNEYGKIISEGYMLNYGGDYPIAGNIDNSWQALYYYNGAPWKEVYVKRSWGFGYEVEWYITGALKRVVLQNGFDVQWLQNGAVMSATFYDPKKNNQVSDSTASKEWLDNLYKRYSSSKNKMLRIDGARDGWTRSYYDDKQVHFETKIKNHKFDSIFRGYYPDGKLFVEWNLKNGIPEGKYALMNPNGTVNESGYYKDGKEYGAWIVNSNTGQPVEEFEYDGSGTKYKNQNVKKEFYPETGKLKSSNTYRNGRQNGLQQTWFKNGQLSGRYESRNDTTVGLYEAYWENGKASRKTAYDIKGRKEGTDEGWHENGNKNYEQIYLNNKKEGPAKGWWKNGKLRYTGFYNNDQTDSLWVMYDSTGKETNRMNYRKGTKQVKPLDLPCSCTEPGRTIGFAPQLKDLVDTSNLDKWQFAWHEKIDKSLKHLFYMDLQNSSSRTGRFNGFTVISYKMIEVGLPDKNGLKLVLNPCFGANVSQVGINANTTYGNPDETRMEIKPNGLAFKFDTKLLKPVNAEVKAAMAYFKVDFMEYQLEGITLHKPKSECFTPSKIGKSSARLELREFVPEVTNYKPAFHAKPFMDSKDDPYNSFTQKKISGTFTGIKQGEGRMYFTYLGKEIDMAIKNVVANNDFVALIIQSKAEVIAGKINIGAISTSEAELKNYFAKEGFSTVVIYTEPANTLTIKLIYKK